jgi:hypothetical protein
MTTPELLLSMFRAVMVMDQLKSSDRPLILTEELLSSLESAEGLLPLTLTTEPHVFPERSLELPMMQTVMRLSRDTHLDLTRGVMMMSPLPPPEVRVTKVPLLLIPPVP